MSSSTSAGQIAGGLIIPVVAGVLNGSWNAAFSPAANLAVAPNSNKSTWNLNQKDLAHNQAWVLFQFYSAIANIILCLFWAGGPERVSWIVSAAPPASVGLVVLFSILMGVGILLFGEACRISGVGLGTNLTIGIITLLGTLLPLALNNQIATPSGGMILGGIAVCCIGLAFSMKSMQMRTQEEKDAQDLRISTRMLTRKVTLGDSNKDSDTIGHSTEDMNASTSGGDEEGGSKTPAKSKVSFSNAEGDNKDSADQPSLSIPEEEDEEKLYSTLTKVTVCFFAALLSSTLQFAFVFGSDLIEIAQSSEGPGSTPESGGAAIIWLFVIPLSTISSITYGLYQSRQVPISNMWRSPLSRHLKIFVCACLPWIGHIHLYGISANLLLPPDIAAAVAWPILMGTTVAWGMILSLKLGEWKSASDDAQKKQKIGLGILTVGIAVVMASVAL